MNKTKNMSDVKKKTARKNTYPKDIAKRTIRNLSNIQKEKNTIKKDTVELSRNLNNIIVGELLRYQIAVKAALINHGLPENFIIKILKEALVIRENMPVQNSEENNNEGVDNIDNS